MKNSGERRVSPYLGRVLNSGRAIGTCFQLVPGIIVTAWHVVADLGVASVGEQVMIDPLEPDGRTPFPATVKLFDLPNDLAVLQTAGDLGGSIGRLLPTDTIAWNAKLIVTGVAEIADPGQGYVYAEALGDLGGRMRRDNGVLLNRLKSSDVVRGMSGAPVRLSDDESAVVGVVSARYNSADGWFRDSVWLARTEDLETLVGNLGAGIARPHLESSPVVSLSPKQQMALGLILSDPEAAGRGAWLYPLHQNLGARGLTVARATITLAELANLGLIERVEVPTVDTLTGEQSVAPAYRVTSEGISVASVYPAVAHFQDRYSYVVRMSGDQASNADFLDQLKSMPGVELQTRFIVTDRDGEARIAAWSREPLDDVFSSLASETNTSILGISRN